MQRTQSFRRRRQKKTNYHIRLSLLKSGSIRLVIRRTNKYITAQFVEYKEKGDNVLLTVSSKILIKKGWKHSCKNTPAAYLLGLHAGNLARAKKVTNAVVDLGLISPLKNFKLYAVIKGAIDAGLKINVNEEVYPSEDRINGKHIKSLSDFNKFVDTIKNGKE